MLFVSKIRLVTDVQNHLLQKLKQSQKFRIITRNDLSFGQLVTQTAHVSAEFQMNFPTEYAEWIKTNRSIISFSVKNGIDLLEAEKMLNDKGVETFRFYEPDYKQVTAIGLVPSELSRKLTSSFRLTRENTNTTSIDKVTYDMMETEQMENLSVLNHGIMVNDM